MLYASVICCLERRNSACLSFLSGHLLHPLDYIGCPSTWVAKTYQERVWEHFSELGVIILSPAFPRTESGSLPLDVTLHIYMCWSLFAVMWPVAHLESLTLCTVRHTKGAQSPAGSELSLHAPFFTALVKSFNKISPIANVGDHSWGISIMAKWPLCTVLCCSSIFSPPLFIDMNKTELISQTRVYFHVNMLI